MNSVSKFTQGFALLFFATVASTHFSQAATIKEMIEGKEKELKQLEAKQQEMDASWKRTLKKLGISSLPFLGIAFSLSGYTPLSFMAGKYLPETPKKGDSYHNRITFAKFMGIQSINILAGTWLYLKYVQPLIKNLEEEEKDCAKQMKKTKKTIADLIVSNPLPILKEKK